MQINTICFFNSIKPWGGGEKWHHDMAIEMYGFGYKVIVIANTSSELSKRLKSAGVKVIEQKTYNLSFLNPYKIYKLSLLFKSHNVSHLIMNNPNDLKLAGLAAKKAGIKNIIYRRGSAIPIKNSILNRFLFGNVLTQMIANTEATKKTITQNNPNIFDASKIEVIYNGIDLQELDNKPFTIENRIDDQIVIGNIGRLVEQKAQHYLIEIAEILKAKNVNFKIKIGGVGKLETQLKKICKEKGLDEVVVFTGFVQNNKNFIENIDIFALTSLWEGFGYVLVEAMACRKPVLAFNLSSNPEIISNGLNGYLIEPYNTEAFAEKIIYLKNNPNEMTSMGARARESVCRNFTIEQSVKNFKRFIDKNVVG